MSQERRCDACYCWHDRPRSIFCSSSCQQAAKRADAYNAMIDKAVMSWIRR